MIAPCVLPVNLATMSKPTEMELVSVARTNIIGMKQLVLALSSQMSSTVVLLLQKSTVDSGLVLEVNIARMGTAAILVITTMEPHALISQLQIVSSQIAVQFAG